MTDSVALLIDIAATHPHVVAHYLEEHPPEAAAALIDTVPKATTAKLLQSMMPYQAAKCLTHQTAETAVEHLSNLESRFAATIMRHLPEETRRGFLGRMTPQAAARVAIILRYSHSVVGAWINPTILRLPANLKVAEARARIKADGYPDYHRIYLVDSRHLPSGYVQISRLLDASDTAPLQNFVEPLPAAIPANLSLDLALEGDRWRTTDYLPVVDRTGQLIGVLRYADLRAATTMVRSRKPDADLSGTFMDLAESCYLGLAEVLNTSLAADDLPTVKRRS